jgi:hypothetical protein
MFPPFLVLIKASAAILTPVIGSLIALVLK